MSSITPVKNSGSTALATRDDNPVSRPSGVAEAAPQKNVRPAQLKWAEVQRAFFVNLKEQGKGSQEKNFRTAFKFFLEAIGKTGDSLVEGELAEEFEATLVVFVKFQKKRGCKKGTYDPRVSKMRGVKQFVDQNFAQKLSLQTLPNTFGKRLLKLISALRLTMKSFWRSLPEGTISYELLSNWCREQYLPYPKHLQIVATIESLLGVPQGTLRIPKYRFLGRDLKTVQSDAGNKAKAALLKPYTVWTESIKKEFKRLKRHKSMGILPEGEQRGEQGRWTPNDSGKIYTAEAVKAALRRFMGYCALPEDSTDPYLRGAGIKSEDLSLALLADKVLIENYLEFMKLRAGLRVRPFDESAADLLPHMISADGKWEFYDKGGKYNSGSISFLAIVSSLLRFGKGYLYQHPEYAEKLGQRVTTDTWEQQCLGTRNRITTLLKSILRMKKESKGENEIGFQSDGENADYEFGRDPKEVIQWILDLPRPLRVLQEMIIAMVEDLLPESAPKLEKARQYRDLVLVSLLTANPLRISMFSQMRFGKHLVRESDGSWWLKFNKRAFKNRASLKSVYIVRVARELWPMLDRYKYEFHPILVSSTGSDYVFVGGGKGWNSKYKGARLSATTLTDFIRRLTELYIPDTIGFGPHAFRHIIATDIIKKDPRYGFWLASIALHDKYETVKDEYVHLKTSEFFEPVNTHFSESWISVVGPSWRGPRDQNGQPTVA